jgi:hypothetical protein
MTTFTEEQKSELSSIVIAAMDGERDRRMARAMEERAEKPPDKDVKLYLVSLSHHQIAFPDDRGRAVLHQSFYARIPMRKEDPQFYGGRIEVVAFGDGKRLEAPVGVVLSGSVAALVEVSESQIEDCR